MTIYPLESLSREEVTNAVDLFRSHPKNKKSFLCLGLDSDLSKIPAFLLKNNDPIFSFNKALVDCLHEFIVAIKINTAFYEENGSQGWSTLEKTINYINLKGL